MTSTGVNVVVALRKLVVRSRFHNRLVRGIVAVANEMNVEPTSISAGSYSQRNKQTIGSVFRPASAIAARVPVLEVLHSIADAKERTSLLIIQSHCQFLIPVKFRAAGRKTFTIRSLLVLAGLFALALAIVVLPVLKRDRLVQRLKSSSSVVSWVQHGDQGLIERVLSKPAKVESIAFTGTSRHERLRQEVFEISSELSPLIQLEVENVEVEIGERYPQVLEKLSIRDIEGTRHSEWLSGLCSEQSKLEQFEVFKTVGFSDQHVVALSQCKRLKSILLDSVNVTGESFKFYKDHRVGFSLTLANCPLSDEGLSSIAECGAIQSLTLSFSQNCNDIPDLQVLLNCSPGVEIYIELNEECIDSEIESGLAALEMHFTNFFVLAL